MYHFLFTIVPLPEPGEVSALDEKTQKTTISFAAGGKIVLNGQRTIEEVHDMDDSKDKLQGQYLLEYSTDDIVQYLQKHPTEGVSNFIDIDQNNTLQLDKYYWNDHFKTDLPGFKKAVSSGTCVIRVRKPSPQPLWELFGRQSDKVGEFLRAGHFQI
jgi:hypothetical protein